MKYIPILILLTTTISNAGCLSDDKVFNLKIESLIEAKEYERAAKELAKNSNSKIAEGYTILSSYIRFYDKSKDKKELSLKYLVKGCKHDSFNACRRYAVSLINRHKYKEAEKLLIKTANNHSDPASAGELISLYHNRNWNGFSKENARLWQGKISGLVTKSNKAVKRDQ